MPRVVEMEADAFMKLRETFKNAPSDSLTLMVCAVVDGTIQMRHIERVRSLLDYPDETLVVAQRRTGTDSAFAEFTVGQVRAQQGGCSA